MTNDKSTREMIFETGRDVKWICKTLNRMRETDTDFELRLRELECWKNEKVGDEKREQRTSIGTGAAAGGIVAVLLKLLGGGP